jgi:hypothetical protein
LTTVPTGTGASFRLQGYGRSAIEAQIVSECSMKLGTATIKDFAATGFSWRYLAN